MPWPAGVYLREAKKFGSTRLRSQCWFKLQDSKTSLFILGLFKRSAIWGKKSFLGIINSMLSAQQSLGDDYITAPTKYIKVKQGSRLK